jgi:SM-20-related protein
MTAAFDYLPADDELVSVELFDAIAQDLLTTGYSIKPASLPYGLASKLHGHLMGMRDSQFNRAGIGRDQQHQINDFVRSDEICWINGDSDAGQEWLKWCNRLKNHLNRRLLLGLFSFESHFAHYAPGDFYRRHLDAFKGQANRVLSFVTYLNPDWQHADGGELLLYLDEQDETGIRVTPGFATMVLFLSEEFPHEVLPATRDRYSIAGWFRVNGSTSAQVDPPK